MLGRRRVRLPQKQMVRASRLRFQLRLEASSRVVIRGRRTNEPITSSRQPNRNNGPRRLAKGYPLQRAKAWVREDPCLVLRKTKPADNTVQIRLAKGYPLQRAKAWVREDPCLVLRKTKPADNTVQIRFANGNPLQKAKAWGPEDPCLVFQVRNRSFPERDASGNARIHPNFCITAVTAHVRFNRTDGDGTPSAYGPVRGPNTREDPSTGHPFAFSRRSPLANLRGVAQTVNTGSFPLPPTTNGPSRKK